MQIRFFSFLIILLIGIKGITFGQDQLFIEVESKVDTSVITIGDRINYSIIIKRDKDLNIARPGAGVNLGMFEIKDYDFPDPEEKDNLIHEHFNFTISVFDTGRFTIPAFPVAYFLQDTSKYQIIEASAIDIYVKSLLSGDEAPELKDIKHPLYIPFNYLFWISMGAILILVAAIVFLSYRLWKKRKERGYLFKPPIPPRPAHEIALEDLELLFKSDLLDKGEYKLFFSRLSEILRKYLEGRYYLSALEQTTSEIIIDAEKHISEEERRDELAEVLHLSDYVKFAKYRPQAEEIAIAKSNAVTFVEETKIIYTIDETTLSNNGQSPQSGEEESTTKNVINQSDEGS